VARRRDEASLQEPAWSRAWRQEGVERIAACLGLDAVERTIDDALGGALLARVMTC